MRAKFSFSAIGALLLGALGCGLISSDITKLTFDLPAKKYTFTAPPAPAGPNIKLTCGAGGAVPTCPAPATCDAGVCTVHYPISVVSKMDLKKDSMTFAQYSSLANIRIENIHYDVVSTANVPIPDLTLYLAPESVTKPDDPQAVKFGTVPTIDAGATTSGNVVKEPDADASFMQFAADLSVPFNIIAATTLTWVSGSPVPTGSVEVTIKGTIAAQPF